MLDLTASGNIDLTYHCDHHHNVLAIEVIEVF